MTAVEAFHDTNIVLRLISSDAAKADAAEALIAGGGHVSVQVLNEFATVATRRLGLTWTAVVDVLGAVRSLCHVHPLTADTHDRACAIAQRYGYALYDSLIIAAALQAGCKLLYSEDLQADQKIERQLTVRNPFHE
jgi:predicted nucleic acid-binding protein